MLPLLLPVVPVPEGPELLLVLVEDPERELLEPPAGPELLVLAGGAREGGDRLRKLRKRTTEKLTSGDLDLEAGSSGINLAVVGRVNELNSIAGSILQGHVGDGETLSNGTRRVRPSNTRKASSIRYLQGHIDIFLNGELAVENGRVVIHDHD